MLCVHPAGRLGYSDYRSVFSFVCTLKGVWTVLIRSLCQVFVSLMEILCLVMVDYYRSMCTNVDVHSNFRSAHYLLTNEPFVGFFQC